MFTVDYFVVISLVFARISGMFFLIPIFSTKNIPNKIKAAFVFFLSLIIIPIVMEGNPIYYDNFIEFAYSIVIEFLIGLSFGMITSIVLSSIYFAGAIIDRNIGFSMVNVISPMAESEMPVSANFYYIFAMMIFLTTNSHHILIEAVLESVNYIPLGTSKFNLFIVSDFFKLLMESFVIGFKISAPFIIIILIANIILGLLSKAMPGMNVFIVGMPFKIFIGLFLIFLMMPIYYNVFADIYDLIFNYLRDLITNYI